jgi:hypothetical protein
MSTTIKRDFTFQAGVYYEDTFIMNIYNLDLTMTVETDSIREQNIAMDRIKYFLHDCVENSVFVDSNEKKVIEKYVTAGLKVCTLPEEPYDQIVTIALLSKINAIAEGRLIISDIVLSSELSDGVKFVYDYESVLHTSPFDQGWWIESNFCMNDINKTQNKKDKIVKLVKSINDWSVVGLEWKEKSAKSAEIIFNPDHVK